MELFHKIHTIAETGIKENYQIWEKHLTRKLNYIALIGLLNISLSIVVYLVQHNYNFIPELCITLFLFPFIIFLNKWFNYNWALYLFYIISLGITLVFTFKMGAETQIYLFFFPLTISMVLLLNRKENYKSLIFLFSLLFTFLITVNFISNYYLLFTPKLISTIAITLITKFF